MTAKTATAKVTTKATPAKPATAAKAKTTAKSTASKTASSTASKTASATAKHNAHLKHEAHLAHLHSLHLKHLAHLAATGKAAGFAVGDLLPVCSAQAVAQSLRLAGQRVSDDELMELHYRAGGSADVPVSVEAALAAAALFGLAGCRPALGAELLETGRADELLDPFEVDRPDVELAAALGAGAVGVVELPVLNGPVVAERVARGHGLILRIDVPGPHAVLATADGWWSWGELYSPWAATIEAAWAVSWS